MDRMSEWKWNRRLLD